MSSVLHDCPKLKAGNVFMESRYPDKHPDYEEKICPYCGLQVNVLREPTIQSERKRIREALEKLALARAENNKMLTKESLAYFTSIDEAIKEVGE